jgi:TonB family protein
VLITPEDTAAAEQQEIIEDAVQDPVSLPVVPAAPVPVSSLNRTKYVAPRYPRAAQRRSISGWVDVVLTVDIDGAVIEVVVRNSDPGTTFVDSAIKAVEGWEFEPIIENGIAVQKRATVRMMFALE